MATFYSCEQNYDIKVNSYSLETLPNEIILNIFIHLTVKDLGLCAQVSKNFRAFAYDKTVWKKVLVTRGVVPHKFLEQALSRGAKYLGLSNLSFISTLEPNFPPKNQVEYLALSSSLMDEKYFRQLILSCHNLKKLSVNEGYWKSDDLIKGILQNSNSLKVLDLSGCYKLKQQDFKLIISSCLKLTEANFDHMTIWDSIFVNLTPNIEKLSLSGAAISIHDIAELMTQCNKITDLDLTWAHIVVPKIERKNIKLPKKTQLKSLYMRGFNIEFNFLDMLILSCENSLKVLDISYCNMTPQAIELIVSRCLDLTTVDFCGEKHAAYICKNVTQNIEKVCLSGTDVTNDDIKTLVSRCNKIKELDISHNDVSIDVVADEIILHLSSTLEKLCLPIHLTRSSKFENCSMFKFGSMPRLKHLWIAEMYEYVSEIHTFGRDDIVDLWERQFPNIVLSCTSFDPIITQPNIAKSMAMDEKIWEIPCEGIELSDIQEDDSTEIKIDASISDTRDDNPQSDFIARELSKLIRDASAFRRDIYEAKEWTLL